MDAASETLAELLNAGAIARAVMSPEPRYMTLGQRNQVMESFVRALGGYHAEHPLRRAMPRGELRNRLQESLGRAVDVRLFNALAETAAAGGIVSADENGMWLPGHGAPYVRSATANGTDASNLG